MSAAFFEELYAAPLSHWAAWGSNKSLFIDRSDWLISQHLGLLAASHNVSIHAPNEFAGWPEYKGTRSLTFFKNQLGLQIDIGSGRMILFDTLGSIRVQGEYVSAARKFNLIRLDDTSWAEEEILHFEIFAMAIYDHADRYRMFRLKKGDLNIYARKNGWLSELCLIRYDQWKMFTVQFNLRERIFFANSSLGDVLYDIYWAPVADSGLSRDSIISANKKVPRKNTARAELSCRNWLRVEFAQQDKKHWVKREFKAAYLELFGDGLSDRGFDRAWDRVTEDFPDRARAGRRIRNPRMSFE